MNRARQPADELWSRTRAQVPSSFWKPIAECRSDSNIFQSRCGLFFLSVDQRRATEDLDEFLAD